MNLRDLIYSQSSTQQSSQEADDGYGVSTGNFSSSLPRNLSLSQNEESNTAADDSDDDQSNGADSVIDATYPKKRKM